MKKLLIVTMVLLTFLMVFSKETVRLATGNWAEGIAMTNLAKVVLEEEMGYEVDIIIADNGPIYLSLSQGDIDAFMDAWLPVTSKAYMDRFKEDLTDLGYNYKGAKIGLVVPAYVNINSIEELNTHKEKFDSEIIGIEAGAAIAGKTEIVIEEYNLDFEQITSSGPVMTASLADAIDNKEWIVVTGWAPHWKFARFDLKFLEDPKGVYGREEFIHTLARRNFIIDMPEVAQFLNHFFMNDKQLGELMGYISDSGKPEESAKKWKEENMDLINNWIPNK
ncbi:glycine betaine ABC transporter substrate-binding protein [Geotoga petraea]|nr:glycine betaine ABC transporter substrate-binding protein [Geotoga petraea]